MKQKTKPEIIAELETAQKRISELEETISRHKITDSHIEDAECSCPLFESMPLGLIVQDIDGNVIDANSSAKLILGLTLEDLREDPSLDPRRAAISEDGSPFSIDTLPAMVALRTGQAVSKVIMGIYDPTLKSHRWISNNAIPQFKQGRNKPHRVYTILEDITEYKLAKDALHASKTNYQNLVESSESAIAVLDRDGKILYSNTRGIQVWSDPSIMGKSIFDIYPREYAERYLKVIRSVIDTGKDVVDEIESPISNSSMWFRLSMTALKNPDGSTTSLLLNAWDITERKRADKKLRDSEEKHRLISELISDYVYKGTVNVDGSSVTHWFSGAIERITGYTLEEVNSLPAGFSSLIVPDDLEKLTREQPAFLHDRTKTTEYRIHRKDGSLCWLRDYMQVISSKSDSDPIEILGAVQDITNQKLAEEKLRLSEEKYRGLVEASDAAIIMLDADGRYQYINEKAAAIHRLNAEQAQDKTLHELLPKEIADSRLERVQKVISTGQGLIIEASNGERFYRTSIQPIHDEWGRTVMALMSATDITELKLAQQDLLELNRSLEERVNHRASEVRDLYENAPIGYHSLDADGNFIMINQTELNWLGFSREEMIGRPFKEVITSAGGAAFQTNFPEFKQRGWVRDLEFEMVRKDGSTFPVVVNATAIYDENGRYFMSRSTVFDITKRKETEDALRRSEATYRALFENSNDGIFLLAPSGREVAVNKKAANMLGYTVDEFMKLPFNSITAPEQIPDADDRFKAVLRGEYVPLYERTFIGKHGKELEVEINLSPVRDPSGRVIMVQSVVRDITERKEAERALRESEERYRKAISAADAVPYSLDYKNKTYTFIGEGIEKISGYTSEEMTPALFDAIIEQTSMYGDLGWLTTHDATRKVRAGDPEILHAVWRSDFRIRHKHGGSRWLSDISVQVLDPEEQVVGSIGILMDITDRKKAEQAMRESEETYRALFENANDAIFLLDPDGKYVRVNSRCEELLGYSTDELINHHAYDFIIPSHLKDAGGQLRKLLGGETVPIYERNFRRKDGTEIEAEINLSLIRDEEGHPKLIQSVVRNITERKRAEKALRESEQQNRLLFEETPETVILFDQTGRVVRVNHALETLTGIPEDQFIGQNIEAMDLLEDRHVIELVENLLRGDDQSASLEFRIRHASGELRDISARIFALNLRDELHYLASMHDITTIKTAEETLRLANVELERALRMKDEFLANMSHELRTPLNAILGLSESLLEGTMGSVNAKQERYLNIVKESGQHLLELINDILDLAKVESGQIKLEMDRVNLNHVCEASLRMIKQLAIKKKQTVHFDVDENLGYIWADERRLKQMIVNLLSNAVKYTPEERHIGLNVNLDAEESRVLIRVWDYGIGITEDGLSRLFQPFVQLDSKLSRESSGTGLGLALVAQMARLHGGSVHAESELNKGSQFTIILPWEPEKETVIQGQVESNEQKTVSSKATDDSGATILLVEDTDNVVMMIQDYLEAAGMKVETARNGIEGISKARSLRPNLILMDVQMPGMDGLEATQRIRQELELKNIPILALTALAMPNDRARCLQAGMNDYISKPVNLKELIRIIRDHLSDRKK